MRIEGSRLREADDAEFGGAVRGLTCDAFGPSARGGVYDRAAPLLQHQGEFVFHAQEHTSQIDVDEAWPSQPPPAAYRKGQKLGWQANAALATNRAKALLPIIKELRTAGVTTASGIATALNERGIPTPRDGKWQASASTRDTQSWCGKSRLSPGLRSSGASRKVMVRGRQRGADHDVCFNAIRATQCKDEFHTEFGFLTHRQFARREAHVNRRLTKMYGGDA